MCTIDPAYAAELQVLPLGERTQLVGQLTHWQVAVDQTGQLLEIATRMRSSSERPTP